MKRYYLMPFVLALGLGMIFVLPRRGEISLTSLSHKAIDMEKKTPPLYLKGWISEAIHPSKKEVDTLNPDTTFIKGTYASYDMTPLLNAAGQRFNPGINLSIVISGFDINNSIHRPERCLRAQGHLEMLSLPENFTTPAGQKLTVSRLTSKVPLAPLEEGGQPFPIGFISYYYFVGHRQITHDHWSRTFLDMKDRLLQGSDQQWSFVMLSMPYNLGQDPADTALRQRQADKKIRQLLGELTDEIVNWEEIPTP
jgi:hypothetical protein